MGGKEIMEPIMVAIKLRKALAEKVDLTIHESELYHEANKLLMNYLQAATVIWEYIKNDNSRRICKQYESFFEEGGAGSDSDPFQH